MESLWRSSCWNPCHCQDDNFNDTKKSNKLWPHLIWAPVVKRSMGVSPPKGAIPSPFLPAHFHLFSHQLNFLRGPLGPRAPGTCPSYLPLSVGLIRRLFSCWNLRNRKPQQFDSSRNISYVQNGHTFIRLRQGTYDTHAMRNGIV